MSLTPTNPNPCMHVHPCRPASGGSSNLVILFVLLIVQIASLVMIAQLFTRDTSCHCDHAQVVEPDPAPAPVPAPPAPKPRPRPRPGSSGDAGPLGDQPIEIQSE